MSEYDAKSRASSKEFRANYDSIFRKKKPSQPRRFAIRLDTLCKAPIPGAFCTRSLGHEGEHA